MASTYTTNAGIELIGTGEQSGTWGNTTNTNLQIIDRLTNGVGAISLSGTTHTLTTTDGTLSDGQYSVLVFGGSPSGTNTVTISPNTAQHVYFVKNSSGQSVVLTQGSGGNVTVANGKSAIVYADGAGAGAAVVDVTNTFNFQPLDAGLTSIAGLTTSANKMIYTTASDTYAVTDLTAAGRAILDDADAAAQRTTLGLGTIATQAANNVSITGGSVTGITDIAVADGGTGVSTVPTNGQLLIGNGSGYTVSTLTAGSGVSITNGSGSVTINATGTGGTVTSVGGTGTVNGLTLTGTVTTTGDLTLGGTLAISNADWSGTDLSVANGGTGASSFTANNVLLGNGTSSFLTVAPGTSGNVLTSNGTTWTSAAASAGALEYISSGTASNSANLTFTLPSGYDGLLFKLSAVKPASDGQLLRAKLGTSNHAWSAATIYSTVSGFRSDSDSNGAFLYLLLGNANFLEQGLTGELRVGPEYSNASLCTAGTFLASGYSSTGVTLTTVGGFQTQTQAAETSIVFSFASGNISSGTITLYGYVTS